MEGSVPVETEAAFVLDVDVSDTSAAVNPLSRDEASLAKEEEALKKLEEEISIYKPSAPQYKNLESKRDSAAAKVTKSRKTLAEKRKEIEAYLQSVERYEAAKAARGGDGEGGDLAALERVAAEFGKISAHARDAGKYSLALLAIDAQKSALEDVRRVEQRRHASLDTLRSELLSSLARLRAEVAMAEQKKKAHEKEVVRLTTQLNDTSKQLNEARTHENPDLAQAEKDFENSLKKNAAARAKLATPSSTPTPTPTPPPRSRAASPTTYEKPGREKKNKSKQPSPNREDALDETSFPSIDTTWSRGDAGRLWSALLEAAKMPDFAQSVTKTEFLKAVSSSKTVARALGLDERARRSAMVELLGGIAGPDLVLERGELVRYFTTRPADREPPSLSAYTPFEGALDASYADGIFTAMTKPDYPGA